MKAMGSGTVRLRRWRNGGTEKRSISKQRRERRIQNGKAVTREISVIQAKNKCRSKHFENANDE